MAKNHGARQQKKLAKQKAKRAEKTTRLSRRTSTDPAIRLARAETWPIVHTLVASNLWEDEIGYLVIARQEAEGRLVFASYLVDVLCLGVKDTFWDAGTPGDFADLIRSMETVQKMSQISPACLAKIVGGAVAFARSFGFPPHYDFRHAGALLEGIDPATCSQEFTFGRDGKPFYIQGPHESPEQARAIAQRTHEAGGHYVAILPGLGAGVFIDEEDEDID